MELSFQQLTKELGDVDLDDILSGWRWCLDEMQGVAMITCMGDMFLQGANNAIYWLQTDCGTLSKVAENLSEFQILLSHQDNFDNWLLPILVEKLIVAGKSLQKNQVYSFKKMPILGGDYSVENFDATDMSVHFFISGTLCEQIKDLPDGTAVSLKIIPPNTRDT